MFFQVCASAAPWSVFLECNISHRLVQMLASSVVLRWVVDFDHSLERAGSQAVHPTHPFDCVSDVRCMGVRSRLTNLLTVLVRFSVSSSHTGQHHRSSVTMKVDACGPKSFWQAGRWRELFGSIFLVSLFFRFPCTREIYFSRLSTCWQRDSGSGEGSIPDREKICYQSIGSVCSGHQALPSWRGWYLLQVRLSTPFSVYF